MKKTIIIAISLILLAILTTGCIKVKIGISEGGIFKSVDATASWQPKINLLSIEKEGKTLRGVNATALVFDPQDSGTLYLGTEKDGVFVSIDAAESWQKISRLPNDRINAIAVHPKAKHIVYFAAANRIFKSLDCCRTFNAVYLESTPQVEIVSLAIDSDSPERIYAGISDGRIIRSENGGTSWLNLNTFPGKIKQILVNPKNTQTVYAVVTGQGIFRSKDSGANWQSLGDNFKSFADANDVNKLIFDLTKPNSLLSASNYWLLRSDDGGDTWINYKLLTSGSKNKIYSLAINPQNPNILYYLAANTLYKSIDMGMSWTTKSLPTKSVPIEFLIDPANPNILYLGANAIRN